MFPIRKSSTELNNASEPQWHFQTALSPEAHAEWVCIRSWNIWDYMRFSHQGRERIGPNSGKTSKNTSPPTPSTSTMQTKNDRYSSLLGLGVENTNIRNSKSQYTQEHEKSQTEHHQSRIRDVDKDPN